MLVEIAVIQNLLTSIVLQLLLINFLVFSKTIVGFRTYLQLTYVVEVYIKVLG